MAMMLEVLRMYPILTCAFVLFPLLGGFVGAYVGFDNLSERVTRKQQQEQADARQLALRQQIEGLAVPVETVRRYEETLRAQGQSFDVVRRVLSQYDQLKTALALRERHTG